MNKQRKERINRQKKLKEWSKLVRQRDGNMCQICGSIKFLNAHHIFPKEAKMYKYLMFDLDNGITLCSNHHKFSYEMSPHKNPLLFVVWFINNRTKQFMKLMDKLK